MKIDSMMNKAKEVLIASEQAGKPFLPVIMVETPTGTKVIAIPDLGEVPAHIKEILFFNLGKEFAPMKPSCVMMAWDAWMRVYDKGEKLPDKVKHGDIGKDPKHQNALMVLAIRSDLSKETILQKYIDTPEGPAWIGELERHDNMEGVLDSFWEGVKQS